MAGLVVTEIQYATLSDRATKGHTYNRFEFADHLSEVVLPMGAQPEFIELTL